MPRYDTGLYQDTMGRLADYVKQKLPPDVVEQITSDVDRNIFGGKVTLPKIVRFGQSLIGRTPEEQLTNFVTPVGMYVKPKWGETGSFSALFDKKPRVEISDAESKLTGMARNLINSNSTKRNSSYPLNKVIEHPELFKRYPELEKTKVKLSKTKPSSFDGQTLVLNTNPDWSVSYGRADVTHTDLLHEIQHFIQEREKWSRGSGSYVPHSEYMRSAGEIEARDTARRKMLNEEQRRSTLPYQGQGIPLKEMIVK
jgi:hypothetical protein